ncbi:MAG: peroxidase [Bryobacterales bacterium]|nr:peroxidase [Bryobacterales bacterium]
MATKHHGLLPFKGLEHLCMTSSFRSGRFARLFANLPPLYVNPLLLHEVGKAGGVMEDTGVPDLTNHTPAGLIFFGQFIDHDITLDDSSSLTASNDPSQTENVRTPTLDLDCVYGDGPGAHPYQYDGAGKLLTGADYPASMIPNWQNQDDLPRSPKGTAIIGDPRNDENRIISQMQLGFLRFHNRVMDVGKEFEEARRIVRWHYQWIVVNEFLRTICGSWIVDDILANGRKVYRPECVSGGAPFIPIEFATAAYRFGHTMIPQEMRVQPGGPKHVVLNPASVLGKGFQPVTDPAAVVDWQTMLDGGNGQFERAGRVDTKLAAALLDLPFLPPALPAFERSLAVRNLLRAQSFLVPSGEQVAEAMMHAGASEITKEMIEDVREKGKELGFLKATPLWLYLLAEGKAVGRMDEDADCNVTFAKGEGLGPVGARFVAEVILGLLELDPRAYLGSNRNWSPLDMGDKIGMNGVTTLYQLLHG